MARERTGNGLRLPVKIFVAVWLLTALAGALNHSVFPRLGLAIPLEYPPHLRFGYVMFNQAPQTVRVVEYKPVGSTEWHHLADLVETPSPLYKRTRVLIDLWLAGYDYLTALCVKEIDAQGAIFRLRHDTPGQPEKRIEEQYRCQAGRFYPP